MGGFKRGRGGRVYPGCEASHLNTSKRRSEWIFKTTRPSERCSRPCESCRISYRRIRCHAAVERQDKKEPVTRAALSRVRDADFVVSVVPGADPATPQFGSGLTLPGANHLEPGAGNKRTPVYEAASLIERHLDRMPDSRRHSFQIVVDSEIGRACQRLNLKLDSRCVISVMCLSRVAPSMVRIENW